MPKRYYSKRTRVVRPKKKWASNLKMIGEQKGTGEPMVVELCSNSVQSGTPTPVILKTGNFKVRLDSQVVISSSAELWPSLNFFVVYMPEGMTISTTYTSAQDYVSRHPEWILCSGVAGSNTATASKFDLETVSFSSRLKRNLNSGDKIVLLVFPPTNMNVAMLVRGMVKYWTCAN